MKLLAAIVMSTLGLAACTGMPSTGSTPPTPSAQEMCANRAQSGARQAGAEGQFDVLYAQCMESLGQNTTRPAPRPDSPETYITQ